jgi:hypothetical protein
MLSLLGMQSQIIANYNYDRSGNLIAPGTPIKRNYGLNWYEFYGQDSWRIKPNLTVTYGLRWSLFPPPWEVNGLQASPTFSLGNQFNQDVKNMQQGLGYDSAQLVSFVLGGKANNGTGFYRFDKSDFAPRFSIAFSPRPSGGWLRKMMGDGDKTVIRAGFGKVYDRSGMQLINTFDQNAPAGLSSTLQNPCCLPGIDDAGDVPRITNINVIPTVNQNNVTFFEPPPPGAFPQTPPASGQAITWGVDDSLKTPYAYTFDFSVGRELQKGFSLQVAYVGRLGRNLLTQRDLRQPLDVVDPKNGIDYFSAARRLSQLSRQGVDPSQITDALVGPTAAYWHDMIQSLPAGATGYTAYGVPAASVVQAVYDLYIPAVGGVNPGNEVVGLGNIDLYGGLQDNLGDSLYFKNANGTPQPGNLLNNQLTSMYAWSSIGSSNYNALQATLQKKFSNGVQFDFNYTYSKSIDFTSAAARVGYNLGILGSQIVNAFSPEQQRAVSDFDATHQFNTNWIADLPFGKGKHFGGSASSALDALIGGWQLSGLARWTSGLPFSVSNGQLWATDWNYSGLAQMVTKPKTGAYRQPDGSVSAFANPAAAQSDFVPNFPGQSGSRNLLRGDGYVGVDMSLTKRWRMPIEGHSLQFRWEVFNVLNQVRFNAQSISNPVSLQQVPSSFGDYTSLLTQPRVMQFALRYEF